MRIHGTVEMFGSFSRTRAQLSHRLCGGLGVSQNRGCLQETEVAPPSNLLCNNTAKVVETELCPLPLVEGAHHQYPQLCPPPRGGPQSRNIPSDGLLVCPEAKMRQLAQGTTKRIGVFPEGQNPETDPLMAFPTSGRRQKCASSYTEVQHSLVCPRRDPKSRTIPSDGPPQFWPEAKTRQLAQGLG